MRVVFAGTPALVLPCFRALLDAKDIEVVGVVSQPDRRSGRGMKLTPSPVKQAAIEAAIDLITPTTLRENDEALHWLKAKKADFLVVIAFGMILPKSWLDAVTIAPVNLHASLLPRWRGAAPIERAIHAGDRETGICVMHMDEGLDTGDIYATYRTKISANTTTEELRNQLLQGGATLLTDTLPKIANGAIQAVPQLSDGICYAEKLTRKDREIEWDQSACVIDRKVRAFSSRPAALTLIDNKVLKIISGGVISGSRPYQVGTILYEDGEIHIMCGKGIYRIDRLQLEGKASMSADTFMRGYQHASGKPLG